MDETVVGLIDFILFHYQFTIANLSKERLRIFDHYFIRHRLVGRHHIFDHYFEFLIIILK